MLKGKYIFVTILLLLSGLLRSQSFKVIGYLAVYNFEYAEQLEWKKLTHVNIAFANPDAQGFLKTQGYPIDNVVNQAHSNGVEVFISLAGGALYPEWKSAWKKYMSPSYRSEFIHKIMDYVRKYELQGVDVDLEWNDVDNLYSPFVIELADSLHTSGRKITAALPGKYRYPLISDEALNVYDWINLMAYDFTGPWNPNLPGQHSSFGFAKSCITYWTVNQYLPKEKTVLGLPAYGYDFNNPSDVFAFYYKSMIEKDPGYALLDQVGLRYYNGLPTIIEKTQYALSTTSGVMIWELSQDALADLKEYSILNAVNSVVKPTASRDFNSRVDFVIFPNPTSHDIYVDYPGQAQSITVQILTQGGQLLLTKDQNSADGPIRIETSGLASGVYLCQVIAGKTSALKMFVKE